MRQVAALVLADVCEEGKSGIQEHIVPCLDALATDQSQAVRVVFSSVVIKLSEPLGKEAAAKVLTPLILQLCKDESLEVRNNVVNNIDLVAEVHCACVNFLTRLVIIRVLFQRLLG